MAIREVVRRWQLGQKDQPSRRLPKPTDRQAAPAGSDLLDLSFRAFADSRRFLMLHSRVLGEKVYFVADETLKPELPNREVPAYTAVELQHLLNAFGRGGFTSEDLRILHSLKKRFGCQIESFDMTPEKHPGHGGKE